MKKLLFNPMWGTIPERYMAEGMLSGLWGKIALLTAANPASTIGIADRTHMLETPTQVNVFGPLPYDANFSKPFDQIVYEQAAQYSGLDVDVCWSGGIDSTLVLLALKAAGANLRVLCTDSSRVEAPELYDQLMVDPSVTMVNDGRNNITFIRDVNRLTVTGEFGDWIFNDSVLTSGSIENRLVPWKEAMIDGRQVLWAPPGLDQQRFPIYTQAQDQDIIEHQLKIDSTSPFPIRNVWQFLMYRRATWRWQGLHYRMFICETPAEFAIEQQTLKHFFEADDFIKWMMVNIRDNKMGGENVKIEAKNIIFQHWPNEDYLNNKVSEPSLDVPYRCLFEDGTLSTHPRDTVEIFKENL